MECLEMAYTKVSWNEVNTPLNTTNLNKMETQYDEVISYAEAVRAKDDSGLCAEVVSSFPSHAAGRLIYHSGNGKGYYSTGSAWVEAFVSTDSGVS